MFSEINLGSYGPMMGMRWKDYHFFGNLVNYDSYTLIGWFRENQAFDVNCWGISRFEIKEDH